MIMNIYNIFLISGAKFQFRFLQFDFFLVE